ncbi:hypothetical protein FGE12_24965 [Aggregicoccus sp. 17bor-14]|uniref:DUF6624 domain-containing protein n=1 Tax=Myxococcaceae TaxID=31 RepID=UPI00129CD434|nr:MULTISPECIES: DUF6624 domain-containing protein [Myxococcaceae]MBF5045682.1 hypothetical protein [Simulacricoccus sp. 17bor-14]MRI91419.1 hypothetical protein [Aggregicoccus sp. 17bor-14]
MRLVVSLLVSLSLVGCAHGGREAAKAPAASLVAPPPAALAPEAEGRKLAGEADRRASVGDTTAALELYRRAWELGVREDAALYNAACAASLAGQTAEALTWLQRAADAGFAHAAHLQQDPDLAAARAEEGFAAVAARVAENEAKLTLASDPALRDALLQRMAEDQVARAAVEKSDYRDEAATARLRAVEQQNTQWLKEQVTKGGWPTRSQVGERGAQAAWLLVQHADGDLAFQKQCLALLEGAAASGEAAKKSVAYLTDRVLVAEGKPQRYGTQFHRPEGLPVPRTMEDPEGVDARRAAMGLAPLADYTQQLEQLQAEVPTP